MIEIKAKDEKTRVDIKIKATGSTEELSSEAAGVVVNLLKELAAAGDEIFVATVVKILLPDYFERPKEENNNEKR